MNPQENNPIKGSKISLISKSGIRYVGNLVNFDQDNRSVTLGNVQMHGTEGRRSGKQIPATNILYPKILFKGDDVLSFKYIDEEKKKIPPKVNVEKRNNPTNLQTFFGGGGFSGGGRGMGINIGGSGSGVQQQQQQQQGGNYAPNPFNMTPFGHQQGTGRGYFPYYPYPYFGNPQNSQQNPQLQPQNPQLQPQNPFSFQNWGNNVNLTNNPSKIENQPEKNLFSRNLMNKNQRSEDSKKVNVKKEEVKVVKEKEKEKSKNLKKKSEEKKNIKGNVMKKKRIVKKTMTKKTYNYRDSGRSSRLRDSSSSSRGREKKDTGTGSGSVWGKQKVYEKIINKGGDKAVVNRKGKLVKKSVRKKRVDVEEKKKYKIEFDFEASLKKFDLEKSKLEFTKKKKDAKPAYTPKESFFDDLKISARERMSYNQKKEQSQTDNETFGGVSDRKSKVNYRKSDNYSSGRSGSGSGRGRGNYYGGGGGRNYYGNRDYYQRSDNYGYDGRSSGNYGYGYRNYSGYGGSRRGRGRGRGYY